MVRYTNNQKEEMSPAEGNNLETDQFNGNPKA